MNLKFLRPQLLKAVVFFLVAVAVPSFLSLESSYADGPSGGSCKLILPIEAADGKELREFYESFETTASPKLLKMLSRSKRLIETDAGQDIARMIRDKNLVENLEHNGSAKAIKDQADNFEVSLSFLKMNGVLRVSSSIFELIDSESGRKYEYGERPVLSMDGIAALISVFAEAKSIAEADPEISEIWFIGKDLNYSGGILKEMLLRWGFTQNQSQIDKGLSIENSSALYLKFTQPKSE